MDLSEAEIQVLASVYRPPEWQLLRIAKQALEELR